MDGESWRYIPDTGSRYAVSSHGRVRYDDPRTGLFRVRKPKLEGHGYMRVDIRHANGRKKYYRIHRLVASLFVPNPENKPEVNHKDGDRANNHVSNLEWADRSDQMRHVYHTLKTSKLNRRERDD